ncbi:hypothetical protein DACRYDRAFT_103233 [Dacryopinax primogenitus]|uniref:Cell division control protein 14 n=1 Tax=Dacryopinax primogenitus (strain DJM 731) TaxID=1858805 RepID=M5G7V4_DACPD|nr:uncharacterized protein DACRYDRAFT_103233 [Dacryopinax primogenitus]EJU06286.1 hypothetical protein DACRYDRAFT_103233 [Dacryopinax primogenitus]
MHAVIYTALDDITSSRSSHSRRYRALITLDKLLADESFETNIVSRLLSFLALSLLQLDTLSSPSLSTPSTPSRSHHHSRSHSPSPSPDAANLNNSIILSLQLLQGCAFLHPQSKAYLGRKAPLQLLLDILLASRPHHAPIGTSLLATDSRAPSSAYPSPSPVPLSPLEPAQQPTQPSQPQAQGKPSIALSILDTLLSILVDSPPSLRAFEAASGLEGVVRTLKRVGVPREVRMRCLEFLYFYLLPEGPEAEGAEGPEMLDVHRLGGKLLEGEGCSPSPLSRPPTPPPATAVPPLTNSRSSSASSSSSLETTASASAGRPFPVRGKLAFALEADGIGTGIAVGTGVGMEGFVPATPKKKLARIGMGTPRHPGSASGSAPGFGPGSGTGTGTGIGTAPGSGSGAGMRLGTGTGSRTGTGTGIGRELAGRTVPSLELTTPGKGKGKGDSLSSTSTPGGMRGLGLAIVERSLVDPERSYPREPGTGAGREGAGGAGVMRSTEEKKERLGAWLGNVDQLVEGVRRAGVWA